MKIAKVVLDIENLKPFGEMDGYQVIETPEFWDRLLKERDEAKRLRLSAPTEGVPCTTKSAPSNISKEVGIGEVRAFKI